MDPEQIGQASAWWTAAAGFFTEHPEAKWLFLAWIFGWVIAFVARPFIRMSPLPDRVESHLVVLACILAATFAAAGLWDGWRPTFPAIVEGIVVSVILGGTSPFGYLGLAWVLCWKWPGLKPHLSLRKDFVRAVDDETETGASPTEPKE